MTYCLRLCCSGVLPVVLLVLRSAGPQNTVWSPTVVLRRAVTLLSGSQLVTPTVMLRRVVALLSGSQVVTPTVMLRRVVALLSGSQLVTPTVLLRRMEPLSGPRMGAPTMMRRG